MPTVVIASYALLQPQAVSFAISFVGDQHRDLAGAWVQLFCHALVMNYDTGVVAQE